MRSGPAGYFDGVPQMFAVQLTRTRISAIASFWFTLFIMSERACMPVQNPGSMYILAGEATYNRIGKGTSLLDKPLDCTYSSIEMLSWADLDPSFDYQFKHLNDHVIECQGETKTGISGGFITERTPFIHQEWTSLTHVKPFLKPCADIDGTYREYKQWSGDVRVGAYQIVQWCRDGKASSEHAADTDEWASDCWKSLLDNLAPSSVSFFTWNALRDSAASDALPRAIIADALRGELTDERFAAHWFSFEELITETGLPEASREAFRSTFGWGFDVQRQAIDISRWEVTSNALQNAQHLTAGTKHSVQMRCEKDGVLVQQGEAPENSRGAGIMAVVPTWSKSINLTLSTVFLLLNISSYWASDSRVAHFVLGMVSLAVLACVWLFEVAVSSQVLKACELRTSGTFGAWYSAVYTSVGDRLSIGGLAIALCQTLCWLSNVKVLCTGALPKAPSFGFLFLGALYAVSVSAICISWRSACAAEQDIHALDRVVPMVFGVLGWYAMINTFTGSCTQNACCEWEKRDTPETLRHLVDEKWLRVICWIPLIPGRLRAAGEQQDVQVCFKKPRTSSHGGSFYGIFFMGHDLIHGKVVLTLSGKLYKGMIPTAHDHSSYNNVSQHGRCSFAAFAKRLCVPIHLFIG